MKEKSEKKKRKTIRNEMESNNKSVMPTSYVRSKHLILYGRHKERERKRDRKRDRKRKGKKERKRKKEREIE